MASSLPLNTGAHLPAIGFGTWQDKLAQEPAVLAALAAGYRHIDTARIYGTEAAVGAALRKSKVPRADVFLTTKLWNNAHHPDDVAPALEASLRDLGVEFVDLYLMHWPVAFARGDSPFPKDGDKVKTDKNIDYVDTWKAMEKLYESGKAKAIGISNFSKAETERLLEHASVVPAVHQIELHPWLQQSAFVDWNKSKGIQITAYSPFGNQNPIYSAGAGMHKLIEEPTLVEIGMKHGKRGAQVALAWGIAKGHAVIPKSKTEERIKANLDSDFKLSEEEVERIDKLDKGVRLNDPSGSFGWDFFADLQGKKQ